MVFAPDLAARKIMIVEKSNAFITLVGGTGSLDEVMEVIELKKYQKHNKPVVILNTNGFYDGLKSQFQTMSDGGFLSTSLEETVRFADTPQEALDYVLSYKRD
jgi:uncharacterized protein (TIGR00730 family)